MTEMRSIGLLALLALASCSEESVPNAPDDPDLPAPGWTAPGRGMEMALPDIPPLHDHGGPIGPEDLGIVSPGQAGASSLAATGAEVIWASVEDGLGRIVVVQAGNGNSEAHPIGASRPYGSIAVDATHFYWADPYEGKVMFAARGVPGAAKFSESPGVPIALVANDTHVFWATIDGDLVAAPKSTGLHEVLLEGPGDLGTLVTDGEVLFWSSEEAGALLYAPIAGGPHQAVYADGPFASKLVLDDTRLYWINSEKGSVLSVPKEGGTVRVLAEDLIGLSGLAVDRYFVYFTTTDDGAVRRVNKDGSNPRLLAEGLSLPTEVAVDDEWIYVIHFGNETIAKFAKP